MSRMRREPYESWGELKRLMKERFVPSYYTRDIYNKLERLSRVQECERVPYGDGDGDGPDESLNSGASGEIVYPNISSPSNLISCNDLVRGEGLVVDKQVALAFTLRNCKDEVVYDVVPMEATYILLDRPQQYDRRVTNDEVTNMFTFEHIG
ncbi:hypothetical protein CR513_39125, partial [Mucuna pruriens]